MFKKHDYDKTLYRLVQILSKLYYGDLLDSKELAEEFNVSVRTIQRDLNERLIGFPISKQNGKWRMEEGFSLTKNISVKEEFTLQVLEEISKNFGDDFSKSAKSLFEKLRNIEDSPIYIKNYMEDISKDIEKIREIESAINTNNKVSFTYKKGNETKEIETNPLKIVNYEGLWYLSALDKKIKTYRLKSIREVTILEEKFKKPKDIDSILDKAINIWFESDKKPFTVKLKVENRIKQYILEKPISPTQNVLQEFENGDIEISVQITNNMEILPTIKYWIPHLIPMEPKAVVDEFNNNLETMLKRFN
ncbi:MAG: transcriptional regulator [Campylobacterales bacterium]|nr:transcriptional regulator [Campylobacterales bacterium]